MFRLSLMRTTPLVAIALMAAALPGPASSQTLDCDPCIDRATYTIRAIVHGTKSSDFWRRVRASSLQAGRDMGVNLQMDLYDSIDHQAMADDIVSAATADVPPDALVVTVPSDGVADAVRTATDAGVPVFGLNSGYDKAPDLGVLGWVAMDEYLGGEEAADATLKAAAAAADSSSSGGNIAKALYINLEKGNAALDERLAGFTDRLAEVSAETVVEELALDGTADDMSSQISSKLEGCPYGAILLSGRSGVDSTVAAVNLQGCKDTTTIGTFDINSKVFLDIAFGRITYGISQQESLQGSLPIVMASLFVTTGQKLESSSITQDGLYLSGPRVFDAENGPSDTLLACTSDAFPVCGPSESTDQCPCTDRSAITIAGVVHGVTTDPAWDAAFAASEQAAVDMGINLELERLEPDEDEDALHTEMADRIESYCMDGVDGIFVTIPSDVVVPAIETCQLLNIPVVSINVGAEMSEALGLMHHIGQAGYNASIGIVDQEEVPYLQGYFPVTLLTYDTYTEQRLVNQLIETGPGSVEEGGLSEAEQICVENDYEVCSPSSTATPAGVPTATPVDGATPSRAPVDGATPSPVPSGAMRLGTGLLAAALWALGDIVLLHFLL